MLVFERAGLLFIFNCMSSPFRARSRLTPAPSVSPTESFVDYRVGVETPGKYKIVLNSDEKRFGGHERVDMNGEYFTTDFPWNGRKNFLQVSRRGHVEIAIMAKTDVDYRYTSLHGSFWF